MGELVPAPVVVKAAIVGVDDGADRVIEVIEYPTVAPAAPRAADGRSRLGFTHVALAVRRRRRDARRARGEGRARSSSTASPTSPGVRTTWFADPWDNVFILVEKVRRPDRPYYRQFGDALRTAYSNSISCRIGMP